MAVNILGITSKLNWALLPISCIMIGFCYLDRSNIAYMQLQLRQPPPVGLSFDENVYGQGSGLFFVGYSLFQIPSNLILVRYRGAERSPAPM
jgi:MFS transporter, ACS family, tartrate transporter